MKGLLAALLTLSILVAALILSKAGPTAAGAGALDLERAPLAIDPEEEKTGDLAPIALEAAPPIRDTAVVPKVEAAGPVAPDRIQEEPQEAPANRVLEGTLTVQRLDGAEQLDASGEIQFVLWSESSGRHQSVPVTGGQFRHELEADQIVERLTLNSVSVGGQPMKVVEPTGDLPLGAPTQIIVKEPRPYSLEVVAVGTEAHLSGVRLVSAPGFPSDNVVIPVTPGKRSLIADHLRSPVDLRLHLRKSRNHDLLVGVEGYEWKRIQVTPLDGGRQRVELAPSGSLTVDVSGVDPKAAAFLRIRRKDRYGPLVDFQLRKDGPVPLSDLAPGQYSIQAEVGDHWSSPLVLGSAEVEVQAGLTGQTQLALDAPPAFHKANIAGRIYVASEWEVTKPRVIFKFLDTPLNGFDDHQFKSATKIESDRAGFDAYGFEAKGMQVGRYSVGLHEPKVAMGVDLTEAGVSDLELVITAPVELLVYVVELGTGEAVETDKLNYNVKRPKGTRGGSLKNAVYDAARGAFVVAAPESV
ncbi:MAG: hypothetical protein AAGG01_17985, partial [Planctomycetota bacterium]